MKKNTSRPWLRFLTNNDAPDDLDSLVNGLGNSDASSSENKPDDDDEASATGGGGNDEDEDESTDEDGSEDTAKSWEQTFPDTTPEEVEKQLNTWKKHSRNWEKQSKENLAELKKLRAEAESSTPVVNEQVQNELHMYQDTIAHVVANGGTEHLPNLLDSVSFQRAYANLDREDADFEESLKLLIEKRVGKLDKPNQRRGGSVGGGEVYQDHARAIGDELFEAMYNTQS